MLSFKFSEFKWTEKLKIELHDIQCEMKFNGKSILGRGTDQNRETAICKATAETLERFFLDQLLEAKTSNGVAMHIDSKSAELNALFELLERDSFFCHFLTKTPFQELKYEELVKCDICKAIVELLKYNGADVKFGSMRSDSRFFGVICAIFGFDAPIKFGMTMGTSVRMNLQDAIYYSLIESARSAFGYILMPDEELLLASVKKNLHPSSPQDHLEVALNVDYAHHFKDTYFIKNHSPLPKIRLNLGAISIASFKPELNVGDFIVSPPLFLAKASSCELLNLYFGEFVQNDKTIERLSRFLGERISLDDINRDVHPFG